MPRSFPNLPEWINPRVLYTFVSAVIIIAGTFAAIEYAKGNYRMTRDGFLAESGLLSANSFPTGAEVYINDKLVTATDDTLYLEPGVYQVKIVKDGFWPWQKTIKIQEELVVQTNAQLFPIAPSLVPLTFSGVDQVLPSPDGQKILYVTSTATTQSKNGLYILDLNNNFLSLQSGTRQIAETPFSFDFEDAEFIWSPDSNEIMILTPNKELLVSVNQKHNLDTLADISFQRRQILSEWEEEMYLRERQFLKEFPEEIISIATSSAKNVYISPDKKRLLYTATKQLVIPEGIAPPVPAPNSQPQTRSISPGQRYVYDREEDTNFLVGLEPVQNTDSTAPEAGQDVSLLTADLETEAPDENLDLIDKYLLATDLYDRAPLSLSASPSAFRRLQGETNAETATLFRRYHTRLFSDFSQWFSDSKHLLYTKPEAVHIKGYDETNNTSVYSGPFAEQFVYPWPDGSKLLILTSFNPDTPNNLYAIELR